MTTWSCEKWFFAGKRPLKPLDEAKARRRHVDRKPYTAVIGDNEPPSHVVSLAPPWVSVSFLDSSGREYLAYGFNEKQPRRLFLKSVSYREFEDEGDNPATFIMFNFDESGHVVIERRNMRTGEVSEKERDGEDVSANWEDYPEFGAYDSLLRRERGEINAAGSAS